MKTRTVVLLIVISFLLVAATLSALAAIVLVWRSHLSADSLRTQQDAAHSLTHFRRIEYGKKGGVQNPPPPSSGRRAGLLPQHGSSPRRPIMTYEARTRRTWGFGHAAADAPVCRFASMKPLPIETGNNTMALLDKLILLNRFMMDALAPRWYVTSGTALGAWRHRKIMPWDIDADIVAEDVDYFVEVLMQRLSAAGLGHLWVMERKTDGVYQFRSARPCVMPHRTPFHMDIHPLWIYYDRNHYQGLRSVNVFKWLDEICLCEINRVLLPCPGETGTEALMQGLFHNARLVDPSKYQDIANKSRSALSECLFKPWKLPQGQPVGGEMRMLYQQRPWGMIPVIPDDVWYHKNVM